MARKKAEPVNKSQSIRDYLTSKPTATPKEIVAALSEQGLTVTEGLVSNVKHNWQKKSGIIGRRGRKVLVLRRRRGANGSAVTADHLLTAKRLADELGGISEARRALDTLEQLR